MNKSHQLTPHINLRGVLLISTPVASQILVEFFLMTELNNEIQELRSNWHPEY